MLGAQGRATLKFTDDLPSSHPKADSLLRFWQEQRMGNELPQRSQFTARLLLPWLPHIAIVESIGQPPRFRVRLMGMAVVRIVGADYTGRFVDECVAEKDRETVVRNYRECAQKREPVQTNAVYLKHHCRTIVTRLLLPCADEAGEVSTILTGVFGTEQAGIFDAGAAPMTSITLK